MPDEPKHTPGPWRVWHRTNTIEMCGQKMTTHEVFSNADLCWVAQVQVHTDCIQTPAGEANAHLISAAPDMYDALRRISLGLTLPEDDAQRAIRKVADEAIARAEGRNA